MSRTRAERRYKKALIKKRAWERSVWNEISTQETRWAGNGRGRVQVDDEFVKNCKRRALRNEGKWRIAGTKPWYGCGADCLLCNPQLRNAWKHSTKLAEINKMDDLDFNDELSGLY